MTLTETIVIAVITAAPSTLAAVASIIAALRVNQVHKLVDGQFSEQLQKTADALNTVAEIKPTLANIQKAVTAQQITDDHHTAASGNTPIATGG